MNSRNLNSRTVNSTVMKSVIGLFALTLVTGACTKEDYAHAGADVVDEAIAPETTVTNETVAAETEATAVEDPSAGHDTVTRTCFADGNDIVFIDRPMNSSVFTGALSHLNSVEVFTGEVSSEQRGGVIAVLYVHTSPVGSGEEAGGPIVNTEEWTILTDPQSLAVEGRMLADVVDCDTINDKVTQLDQFVTARPDAP